MTFEEWLDKKISREEEANMHDFLSHEEAEKYFKENYKDFIVVDSIVEDGTKWFLYDLVFDKDSYMDMHNRLRKGRAAMTDDYLYSHQRIEISEHGLVHIVH